MYHMPLHGLESCVYGRQNIMIVSLGFVKWVLLFILIKGKPHCSELESRVGTSIQLLLSFYSRY